MCIRDAEPLEELCRCEVAPVDQERRTGPRQYVPYPVVRDLLEVREALVERPDPYGLAPLHAATGRQHRAADKAEQRRLARAVGTQHRQPVARTYAPGDIGEDGVLPV